MALCQRFKKRKHESLPHNPAFRIPARRESFHLVGDLEGGSSSGECRLCRRSSRSFRSSKLSGSLPGLRVCSYRQVWQCERLGVWHHCDDTTNSSCNQGPQLFARKSHYRRSSRYASQCRRKARKRTSATGTVSATRKF